MRDELITLLNEAFEAGIITSTVQSQIDALKASLKLSDAEYTQIEDEIRIATYIRKVKEREKKGVTFMGDLRKQYKITDDDKLIIQKIFDAEPKRPAPKPPEPARKPEPAKKTEAAKSAETPKKTDTPKQSSVLDRSELLKQHAPGLPKEEPAVPEPAKKTDPVKRQEKPPRPEPQTAPPPAPAKEEPTGPLILVADDNETQLFLTRKILEEYNYRCVTADSPETAVRIISEKQPALVLCDINFGIGKPTGMDVFTNTRTKKFMMPFILVSAFIQKEFKDHAKRIGVTEYINKPTEPEELIAVIKKYIG